MAMFDSGFPCGASIKNPPANTGDVRDAGLILACVPQLLKPTCPRAHAWQQEKPPSEKPAHCD